MDCNTCKHNFVCKYKEEYIRVRDKSNSEEFKGIFDICCNEYLEDKMAWTTKSYMGFKIGDNVCIYTEKDEIFYTGRIASISDYGISIENSEGIYVIKIDTISTISYSLWE